MYIYQTHLLLNKKREITFPFLQLKQALLWYRSSHFDQLFIMIMY